MTGFELPACCRLSIILVPTQSGARLPRPWEVPFLENAPPLAGDIGRDSVVDERAFILLTVDHNLPTVKRDGDSVDHPPGEKEEKTCLHGIKRS